MPASLILLDYSQSYRTMRNKSALSKNKEVWKSMALPNNVLEHYTWGGGVPEIGLKKQRIEYKTERAI